MKESVVYVFGDKTGGVASLNSNLMRYPAPDKIHQFAVLFGDRDGAPHALRQSTGADTEVRFQYSAEDNVYAVLRRLEAVIPSGPGALVSNDWIDLALYSLHRPSRTIYQIVHDEYNFGLTRKYEPIIDVMIAHSRFFFEKLQQQFPHRRGQIMHIPYGIPLAPRIRTPQPGPLRLVFLGRLVESKGVLDLPTIDQLLVKSGIQVCWKVIGDGPEKRHLMAKMPPSVRVAYHAPEQNAEVLELCAAGDVFVLPTRFEGFPVALLEAMSAGLVPVVSNLPSGVPEVVIDGVGFRPRVADCQGFASAITCLARDPDSLERMSVQARRQAERFEVNERARAYHEIFARSGELKRPWGGPLKLKHGSRLDQPWLPNAITRFLRSRMCRERAMKSPLI